MPMKRILWFTTRIFTILRIWFQWVTCILGFEPGVLPFPLRGTIPHKVRGKTTQPCFWGFSGSSPIYPPDTCQWHRYRTCNLLFQGAKPADKRPKKAQPRIFSTVTHWEAFLTIQSADVWWRSVLYCFPLPRPNLRTILTLHWARGSWWIQGLTVLRSPLSFGSVLFPAKFSNPQRRRSVFWERISWFWWTWTSTWKCRKGFSIRKVRNIAKVPRPRFRSCRPWISHSSKLFPKTPRRWFSVVLDYQSRFWGWTSKNNWPCHRNSSRSEWARTRPCLSWPWSFPQAAFSSIQPSFGIRRYCGNGSKTWGNCPMCSLNGNPALLRPTASIRFTESGTQWFWAFIMPISWRLSPCIRLGMFESLMSILELWDSVDATGFVPCVADLCLGICRQVRNLSEAVLDLMRCWKRNLHTLKLKLSPKLWSTLLLFLLPKSNIISTFNIYFLHILISNVWFIILLNNAKNLTLQSPLKRTRFCLVQWRFPWRYW